MLSIHFLVDFGTHIGFGHWFMDRGKISEQSKYCKLLSFHTWRRDWTFLIRVAMCIVCVGVVRCFDGCSRLRHVPNLPIGHLTLDSGLTYHLPDLRSTSTEPPCRWLKNRTLSAAIIIDWYWMMDDDDATEKLINFTEDVPKILLNRTSHFYW